MTSRRDSLPAGELWCTVHQTSHPEHEFNWKDRDAGIRQSRCRVAQAAAAAASYAKHRDARREAAAARRERVVADLGAQLRTFMVGKRCADCGDAGASGLLASMPDGLPTPAEAVRRQLAGVDLAHLVDAATWRCRACAGSVAPRRVKRLQDAVRAVVAEGGEWTVEQVRRRLADSGHDLSAQHVRNLLAALCSAGHIQRFDTGVYRVPLLPPDGGLAS